MLEVPSWGTVTVGAASLTMILGWLREGVGVSLDASVTSNP